MDQGTPESDIDISSEMVAELIRAQCPQYAALPIDLLGNGWDNMMFRLGDQMIVRLPRRETAAPLIVHEQVWLPRLAPKLPIATSAPVFCGTPHGDYPWHWNIVPYHDGDAADVEQLHEDQGPRLAEFLLALHQPADAAAPENPFRGKPLQDRANITEERLARLVGGHHIEQEPVNSIWKQALSAPQFVKSHWLHGDLHARNVLAKNGQIVAIVDWGDMTSGDIATDLASIWYLLPHQNARRDVLSIYRPSKAEIHRSAGWAVNIAAILLDTGLVDHPRHAEMGRQIFDRVIADFAGGFI